MSAYFDENRHDHMMRLNKIRDWDIANMAVKIDFVNWLFLHHSLKSDKFLAMRALSAPCGYVPIEVTGQLESPLQELRSYGLMQDRDVVLAAIKIDCDAIKLASDEIQLDDQFMEEAVAANPRVVKYARVVNPRYPDLVLAAVKKDCSVLKDVAHIIRHFPQKNREVVVAAISQDPSCLKFASEDLRADRSIVLSAVRKYGRVLVHASEALKNDVEVVMTAIRAPRAFDMLSMIGDELASDEYVQRMAARADRLCRCHAWFRFCFWGFAKRIRAKNDADNYLRRHGLEEWMDSKAKLMCYRPAKRARVTPMDQ